MASFRDRAKKFGRKVQGVGAKASSVVLPAVGAVIGGTAGAEVGALASTAAGRYGGAAAARNKGLKGVDARTAGRTQAKRNFKIGQTLVAVTGGYQAITGQNFTQGILGSRSPAPNPQSVAGDTVAVATGANVGRASAAEGSGLLGQALDFIGLGKPDAQQSPAASNVPGSADMFGASVPLAASQNGGMEPDLLSPSTWPGWYWIVAGAVVVGGAVAVGVV